MQRWDFKPPHFDFTFLADPKSLISSWPPPTFSDDVTEYDVIFLEVVPYFFSHLPFLGLLFFFVLVTFIIMLTLEYMGNNNRNNFLFIFIYTGILLLW